MERLKLRGKEEEEQPVIERVAFEVKRMHASSNTLASKMRKDAEDTKRRAEERRKEAVREMQGRLAQYKKESEAQVEKFRENVKRMHASSNTLASKMRKDAEDTKRRAEERRKEAVREMQGRLAQYKKESEAQVEKFRENVRRRIAHTWGTHKPGTRVTDIV